MGFDRKAILLFVPGNPGIISYYTSFFETLRKEVPGLDIISSNYVGFNVSDARKPSHSIALPAQIAATIGQLDNLLKAAKSGKIPVYLAGHSVGAYICLQVLKARSECIHRVYLLTPTINDIAESPQGRILTPLYRLPGFVTFVASLVWCVTHVMPKSLLLAVIQKVTKLPREAALVTMEEVVRDNIIYTVLTLAQSEMELIRAPDRAFWKVFAARCSAYWAEDDHWVSLHHRAELLGIAEGMESYHCQSAPHAFCIRHGDVVAAKVAEWIIRDIQRFSSTEMITN